MIYTSEIIGLDELIKAFMNLPEEALTFVSKASYPPAEKIMHRARGYLQTHNKTGALSQSLKVNKPSRSAKYKYTIFSKVWFGTGGAHGVPVELGHRLVTKDGRTYGTVKEYPFLRPAADEGKDDVVSAMVTAINTALDKMGGQK